MTADIEPAQSRHAWSIYVHRTINLRLLLQLHIVALFQTPTWTMSQSRTGKKEPTRHTHTRHGPGALLSKRPNEQTIYILMYINKTTLARGGKASARWYPPNPWVFPPHITPTHHTYIVTKELASRR